MQHETDEHDSAYEAGKRASQLQAIQNAVSDLQADNNRLKAAVYGIYGAIFLVQLLPELQNILK